MCSRYSVTVLVCIACANIASAEAPNGEARNDQDQMEIGLTFAGGDSGPHKVGSVVAGTLLISYKKAPSGSSVYLTLHPLNGDAMVTPEGVGIRATDVTLDVDLVASLQGDSDGGPFRIGRANHPDELLIPASALETLAGQVSDKETAKAVVAAFGPQGLRLILGFLASLGRGGDGHEQAFFSFVLPRLQYPYDGVLITPMLLSYEADDQSRIVFRSRQMHSLKISVAAD